MNIFVANLDYGVSSEKLQSLFEEHGSVDSAKVITDKYTGQSRGFGFVEMSDDEAAKSAIATLNGTELNGREIVVRKAEPRG